MQLLVTLAREEWKYMPSFSSLWLFSQSLAFWTFLVAACTERTQGIPAKRADLFTHHCPPANGFTGKAVIGAVPCSPDRLNASSRSLSTPLKHNGNVGLILTAAAKPVTIGERFDFLSQPLLVLRWRTAGFRAPIIRNAAHPLKKNNRLGYSAASESSARTKCHVRSVARGAAHAAGWLRDRSGHLGIS